MSVSKRNQKYLDPKPALELALQLAPVSEWSGAMQIKTTCVHFGLCARQWHRWSGGETMMTVKSADEFALKLGLHPAEIWGDDWFTF